MFRAAPIGPQRGRTDLSGIRFFAGADESRRRPVSKDRRHRKIVHAEMFGVDLRRDQEDVLGLSGLDHPSRHPKPINESRTPQVEIETGAARGETESRLNHTRCRRQKVVGRLRAEKKRIDLGGVADPAREEPFRRANRQIGNAFVRSGYTPFRDAGLLQNLFRGPGWIAGDQILVRAFLGRQVTFDTCDGGFDHKGWSVFHRLVFSYRSNRILLCETGGIKRLPPLGPRSTSVGIAFPVRFACPGGRCHVGAGRCTLARLSAGFVTVIGA